MDRTVPFCLPRQTGFSQSVKRVVARVFAGKDRLRILYACVTIVALTLLFTGIMRACESQVLPYHIWGSVCSALLLGAVGLAAAGLSGNTAGGYMVCMLYYLASYGMGGRLGCFSLFSMTKGEMSGKGWQLLAAVLLAAAALTVMRRRQKL